MTPALLSAPPPSPCQFATCYAPQVLLAAYDVPGDITRGAGQTIVIISAFDSSMGQSGPSMAQTDLDLFDSKFGLPAGTVTVTAPDGLPPFDMSQRAWVSESSVDVEWAHAVAPGASLVLVEAKSADDADILSATKYAVDHNLGDVISMSFSEVESCPSAEFLADEHATFQSAVANGITLVAASGDSGAAQRSCNPHVFVAGVATPASDPLVTAVGGTRISADSQTGAYKSEVAWSNIFGASGGGLSAIYHRPGYQSHSVVGRMRGVPDVSWTATTFVAVHGHVGPVAATSAGAPAWAGIAALADQAAGHRLGVLNVHLYHAAKSDGAADRFHDIIAGNNAFTAPDGTVFDGLDATPGWDPVTGLGTPDVSSLVAWIAAHS